MRISRRTLIVGLAGALIAGLWYWPFDERNFPQVLSGMDPEEAKHRRILRDGADSVEKDLTLEKYKAGSDFSVLRQAWPPTIIIEHGPFTTAIYGSVGPEIWSYDHTFVIAVDGKLVRAHGGGCVWRCTFFDTLGEEKTRTWSESLDPALLEWKKDKARQYNQQKAAIAAAGPIGAVVYPTTWPQWPR